MSIENDNGLASDALWRELKQEAEKTKEPLLKSLLDCVLGNDSLDQALADLLGKKLASDSNDIQLSQLFKELGARCPKLIEAAACDLLAIRKRDSACQEFLTPFLFFKGFHALQSYRYANQLWSEDRHGVALLLQSLASERFGVDIHPEAQIGRSIMMDHGTGIVVGQTCVIADHVSIMQGVTLGGTGKEGGDRHPKIDSGALISAGAIILGNIRVGRGAKIAAGSVVLSDVPAHTTVAGIPAKPIGRPKNEHPALTMEHDINDKKNDDN